MRRSNTSEELEYKSFLGFSITSTKEHFKACEEGLRQVQKSFLTAGFSRVEETTDYWEGVHFNRGKHRVTPRIREWCRNGKEPTGELMLIISGNWISDITIRGNLLKDPDRAARRTISAIERRERDWVELNAKMQAQHQASINLKQKQEDARRQWYEARVARLQNGELTTGLPELDLVIWRWSFLPEAVRLGILAMVRAMPQTSDEQMERDRLAKEASAVVQSELNSSMQRTTPSQ